MPEGPEVKKAVDFLNKELKNKEIIEINFLEGRYKEKIPENFEKLTFPLKFESINCKGKFIWFELSSDLDSNKNSEFTFWHTFGLSGYWKKNIDSSKYPKYSKIEFKTIDSSLIYIDKLGYGTLKISSYKNELDKKINDLGLDILESNNNSNKFIELINKKKKNKISRNREIGSVLLDQKICCGCGNYLRADCLYLTKLNPYKTLEDIKDEELIDLWNNLQKSAYLNYDYNLGINKNIISDEDVDNFNQNKYDIYSKNFDWQGYKVIKEKMKDRTIHWCPDVQL